MSSEVKSPERLLYSREQTAELLGGVSVATVIRLEGVGKLKPVKLSGKKAGRTFYRAAQVRALAEAES